MNKTLLMQGHHEAPRAWLMVNGLAVLLLRPGQRWVLSVHEYLSAGDNRIQVRLLDPLPQGRVSVGVDSHIELVVQKHRGPDVLVQGQVLYRLTGHVDALEPVEHGLILDRIVNLPIALPTWQFMSLPERHGYDQDQALLGGFVASLLHSLERGQTAQVAALFAPRLRELAQAYQQDVVGLSRAFQAHLERLCAVAPLDDTAKDPAQWLFWPECGQQAWRVVRQTDHTDLLAFADSASGQRWTIPIHATVLNGEVRILK